MLLQIRNVSKQFGSMYALRDVSIAIKPGEVHGLVGENGAGKSTLIKILTGVYSLDSGGLVWNGEPVEIHSPRQSRALGINVIHQDRNLIPAFSGVENVYLGLDYEKKAFGRVDWAKMRRRVEAVAADLGVEVDIVSPASSLSPPQRTLLEIVRAMMTECRLLILDEPTASLTNKEAEVLFEAIATLKSKGTSILYVTHRMEEIFRLTDRVTVLKNGRVVDTVDTGEMDRERIISMMTDNWTSESLSGAREFGEPILAVEHLHSRDGVVRDVSFTVRRGEILGIFGLGGSGRTEALECVYGYRAMTGGTVTLDGEAISGLTPSKAIRKGMSLICEDRRGMALVTSLGVRENTVLSTIDSYARFGVLDSGRQYADTREKIDALQIKTEGPDQRVEQLSGGNQQKVVFAKALMSAPKVMLCDEPTQAVDVKTRGEIHRLLRELADGGSGVVFVSSDLKEVLEVADNVQVVANGRTRELFANDALTAEQVLSCCYEN